MNDKTRSETERKLQRFYFYAFSFHGRYVDGRSASASAYMCYSKNTITNKKILSAKEAASVCKDAVLIAVSYLGHMTKDEFFHE